jgi:hypothetical protein
MPPRITSHTIRHVMTIEGTNLDTDALVVEHVPAGAKVSYVTNITRGTELDYFYLVWVEPETPSGPAKVPAVPTTKPTREVPEKDWTK